MCDIILQNPQKGLDKIIMLPIIDSGLRTQDSGLRTNYALMKYSYVNIGDEIQSIAAKRFLPNIDYYIYREHLSTFHNNNQKKIKMILNGWFMHSPDNFPPSDEIEPLLISIHLWNKNRNKIIENKKVRDYFIQYGPIGCRDKDTMNFLLEHNIPAYFSGCMTTTLIPNLNLKSRREDEYVLCVDVSDEVYDYVLKKACKPVFRITKNFAHSDSTERFKIAEIMLFLYHQASAVITMNLHTALPCLAMKTPVCLIDHNVHDGRFEGLNELLFHCSEHDFINTSFYDFNNPPANNDSFIQIQKSLVETCRTFTGFDAEAPIFEDDYKPDIFSLMNMLSMNNNSTLYPNGKI